MNPLVVLLIAASTTAADPMPVAQGTTTPAPVYSYSEPASAGTTDSSRPRLFSRIRKLFRRGSQPADEVPMTITPAPTRATTSVWGTTSPQPVTSVVPSATAPLRPVPTVTPPPEIGGPAQRMPTGSPF